MALAPLPAAARSRVVDKVGITAVTDGYEIRIDLNFKLRYLSHAPTGGGDTLQIELRSVASADDADLDTREALSWNPAEGLPLFEMTYDGDTPNRPNLTLRFTRPVRYLVRGAGDLRSVVIVVRSDRAQQPTSTVAPDTTPPAQLEPAEQETSAAAAQPSPQRETVAPPPDVVAITDGPPDAAPAIDLSYPYAINLFSLNRPVEPSDVPSLDGLEEFRLYTTLFEKEGTLWHRLRLGFFPTDQAARRALKSLDKKFSRAWVTKVSLGERERSAQQVFGGAAVAPMVSGAGQQAVPKQKDVAGDGAPALPPDRLGGLMDEAEAAVTRGDYRRAIQLYTKVLQFPDHEFRQPAREFLGLARERNGQFAHAKAVYDEYLLLYPKGEGADRVRQRLAALVTARSKPKEKLRQAKAAGEESAWQTEVYGSVSQFYNRDVSFNDTAGTSINQSDLASDLDFNASLRSADFEFNAQFIGGHVLEFREGSQDDSRVNVVYLEGVDLERDASVRIGRQSRSTGGVLGRFDGGLFDYQILPEVRVIGVAGYPVESTTAKSIDTDKYFYGLSFDLGTFADYWDFNIFAINQEADGITDRRAVGGEVRYFQDNRSLFSLIDYDVLYNELNTALFVGNWTFPNRTTLNFSLDYRKSPILTTSNAIQGQGVNQLADLEDLFSEEELRDLAVDRTATSRSATLGASHPINDKLQINGDVTISNFTSTESSGGVEASPGTGVEYFYSGQLIGSSLIKEGDIAILGLRFADTNSSKTTTFTLNTRYPITREWRLNPRFRAEYRRDDDGGGDRFKARPSFRMDYYWRRIARFEIEGGVEWSDDRVASQSDITTGYFLRGGYRVDF